MPILDQTAKWTTNKLPKVISPTAHAVIDYAMAASFWHGGIFLAQEQARGRWSAGLRRGGDDHLLMHQLSGRGRGGDQL